MSMNAFQIISIEALVALALIVLYGFFDEKLRTVEDRIVALVAEPIRRVLSRIRPNKSAASGEAAPTDGMSLNSETL